VNTNEICVHTTTGPQSGTVSIDGSTLAFAGLTSKNLGQDDEGAGF
jgi:hypothetical protein